MLRSCGVDAVASHRSRATSPLLDEDGSAEGRDVEDGAAVAEGAAHRPAADATVRRDREVGLDVARERARVELEAGVAREFEAHVAREALELVPAVLQERAGQ